MSGSALPAPGSQLLSRFRSDRKRLPLHPLEKAVLAAVTAHLCFLPWAIGTMHPWSQVTSLVLASIGFLLALLPRTYSGDYMPGGWPGHILAGQQSGTGQVPLAPSALSSQLSVPSQTTNPNPTHSSQPSGHGSQLRAPSSQSSSGFRSQVSGFKLNPLPRLLRFPLFWIGLLLLAYIAAQDFNPSWVWERNATSWWLRRVTDIEWLPTSIDTPWERFNLWRQFIIYASAWLTVCTIWTGFTRRHSLQLLLLITVANAVVLAAVGFFQKFAGLDSLLYLYKWPPGHTAFASFIYRNHAGAYFALLTLAAAGLALWFNAQGDRSQRKSTPAGLFFFAAVFLTAAVFFSLSRGASLTVSLAWLSVGFWFWLRGRLRPAGPTGNPAVTAAVAVLFAVVIGATVRELDFGEIESRFDSLLKNYRRIEVESVQSRLLAHESANQMLADHWQRGVGAGGFRFLFPEYIKDKPMIYHDGQYFWEHAHSDWREIPIELGATGVLLLLLAAGWWLKFFIFPSRRAPQVSGFRFQPSALWHSLAIPILIGCAGTLGHAWFDFPFQNPAILCTWLALIALSARWVELDAA